MPIYEKRSFLFFWMLCPPVAIQFSWAIIRSPVYRKIKLKSPISADDDILSIYINYFTLRIQENQGETNRQTDETRNLKKLQ